MRYYFFVVSCLILVGCFSSNKSSSVTNSLPATALTTYGRTAITADQKLELISSAAYFGFSFKGTTCQVDASINNWQDHNYLQYEMDGVYQKRIKVSKNSTGPIVLTATNDGKHTVWIYKATEATTGPIFIEKITGTDIAALHKPEMPFIEFIGNSITCGAAADASEIPCGVGEYHDHHNAYAAYGPRVARALGANYILSSVSGIGIYRNWNSDGPAMPQVYEHIDFQEASKPWNFSLYHPKVISIALGTNDFSSGDGKKKRLPFDSAAFVNSYVKFVQLVKSKNPDAQIALLSSAMVNGKNRELLQNCLSAVKNSVDALFSAAKPVALYFFNPMQARGCGGHPSVEDHAILANELQPFFKKLLQ